MPPAHKPNIGIGELIKHLAALFNGRIVSVDADENGIPRAAEYLRAVAAAAKSAVDVNPSGTHLKRVHRLLQHH